jgi:Transposase DDE domain group 1
VTLKLARWLSVAFCRRRTPANEGRHHPTPTTLWKHILAFQTIRTEFNGSLRIEGRPERLTSESGAVILREVMERMGITEWLVEHLVDRRNQDFITHPLSELLRTRVMRMALGWHDGDDADALRNDPALRLSVSDRRGDAPLQQRTPLEDGKPLSHNPDAPDGLASQPT